MTLRFKRFYYFAFMAIAFSSADTLAQTRTYRVADRQVQTLINRLENKTNAFRQSVAKNNSKVNEPDGKTGISLYVNGFRSATSELKNNFSNNRSTGHDVQEVLSRAVLINRFMQNHALSRNVQSQWNSIRTDLNTLANYYRVSWNWNDQNHKNYPNNNQNDSFDSRLTGTYQLNSSQSDNVADTVEKAISNLSYNVKQRERVQNDLQRRLISPQTMTIEKHGQQITLASSIMSQVSFKADGQARSETSDHGRTVKVRRTLTGNDLSIKYEGDRLNDYYVSFTPTANNQLRVTRRVYIENRKETVTIASIYDKTDRMPIWNAKDSTTPDQINDSNINSSFIIPNNTRMTAALDAPLSTKTAKNNDQVTMTVIFPSQYKGAIIEGRVIGKKSGLVSSRAALSLTFETIRFNDGSAFRFAGIIEQVRLPNGNDISVNNEGKVREDSQTTKTVTRAGVGARVAIGTGTGAAPGAGSVVWQGLTSRDLPSGSEFTIIAVAPSNLANIQ